MNCYCFLTLVSMATVLLWCGAALQRAGKAVMFVGVMSSWMCSTLQVGVGFVALAHTYSLVSLTAADLQSQTQLRWQRALGIVLIILHSPLNVGLD
jgi:hypothetical protein